MKGEIQMSENNLKLRLEDLVNNPTARVPVCLCLDVSGSMMGDPIQELNEGVRAFYQEITDDEVARYAAEVSIVTFGGKAECIEDFANVERQTNIPELMASGGTPMGEAVNMALDLLEERKQEYKDKGVDYYQPWLIVMTDGQPNGSQATLQGALDRTVEMANNRKLSIFPIAIGEDADLEILRTLSPKRTPLRLNGLMFKEFFVWLGKSIVQTSNSMPGESIPLDVDGIKGWASL